MDHFIYVALTKNANTEKNKNDPSIMIN